MDRLPTIGTAPAERPSNAEDSAPGLRCQWCSVALPAGATVCPNCGSPGIPDPRLTSVEDAPAAAQPIDTPDALVEPPELLLEGEPEAKARPLMDAADAERRQLQSSAAIVIGVVVCVALGWLIGPNLLAPGMERLTGAPVAHPADLRGLGAFVGLLAGVFVGGLSGWAIWSAR